MSRVSAPVLTRVVKILEPPDTLLTHPRNQCEMDQQVSPLYLAVTKLFFVS